ncbi:MAG: CPBP family intramembrane glutamic endopeptidase [Candidatus Kariarchaeaceae archaeon]
MLIRNKNNEVRLIWRFLILIISILLIAFLLRFIPILIQSQLLQGNGLTEDEALQSARTLILETPIWSTILGSIQGIMWFIIIYFLIRVVEKNPFSLKELGLDWKHNTLNKIFYGIIIAVLIYFVQLYLGKFLGSNTFSLIERFNDLIISSVFLTIILNIFIGFGEEAAFRAYLQTRMIKLYGTLLGIILTSIIFTLTHLIVMELSLVNILAGIMLYISVGILYYCTQSLYLVGAIHAVLNILLQVLDFTPGDMETLIVHSLFLLVVSGIYFQQLKVKTNELYQLS